MKEYDATEQAFWNGYRKAVETFEKSQKTEANPIEKSEAEIMKALECLASQGEYTAQNALDLINRIDAENEKLSMEIDELIIAKDQLFDEAEALIKKARAEAIKEFAERLKEKYKMHFGKEWNAVYNPIDQIAKELGVEL